MCDPQERLWRERLTAANPAGHVHWLGSRTSSVENEIERAARLAAGIHEALVAVLPDHRDLLDARLTAERVRLCRLRLSRLEPLQLTSSD
jgi:hypothetical protein